MCSNYHFILFSFYFIFEIISLLSLTTPKLHSFFDYFLFYQKKLYWINFNVFSLSQVFFVLFIQDTSVCKLTFICSTFILIIQLEFHKVFFQIKSYFSKFKKRIVLIYRHFSIETVGLMRNYSPCKT